ncbi:LOW QUALITY PROTEIN: palmitoyltransferase ZDHHC18-like [Portunus trituberculatus]|uniref:LOW QUALITY PROTEIN: palmitoyltransferase ZDHHC18-like n=1 Tax=Portunus trituberculatus TaxID=210409 RepID=UPI001E1D0393|nr:LOW QUALITY PROTEIN: palmitoyltransferase ZDHHC18-like [Portunus trituberculatus]
MLEAGEYQRVALESPSQSPTQSSDRLLDNKCVQSSASSSSEDNLDLDVTSTAQVKMASVKRKWQIFPGRNKFCCDGRIIMAQQTGIFYFTVGLIVVTSVLFFVFDCPFLAVNLTPAIPAVGGLLFIFVMSALFHTSFTDPGIIPRATVEEAVYTEKQIEVPNSGNGPRLRPPPRTKEITVNGVTVKLKYCFTCKIFRPPRASHCSICDNCVERFDHHCPWVGNCVGRRNYRYFYLFIISLAFLCVFIFSCVIAHIVIFMKNENATFMASVQRKPASVIEGVICFFSVWSILGLAGFHTYLTTSNQTTNEDIKGSFTARRGEANFNPYGYGNFCLNCLAVLCGPVQPSLIDRRGVVTSEYLTITQGRPGDIQAASRTYGTVYTAQPTNGLVSPRAGSEGPAGTHGANGGVVVGGGVGASVVPGTVPVMGGGAIATENSISTGSLKKKSVSSQSVNGKDVVGGGSGSLGAPTPATPHQGTVVVGPTGTPPGDLSVTTGPGVGVGGSHAGVTSSQLYLLDSSYDLDLDSIDGSVSQPSHSESSQLGLIHSNAV